VKGEIVPQQAVPPETQFINRFLHAPQAGSPAVDTYSFQTHWGVPLSEHSGPSTVAFQEQDFYKHAVAAKTLHLSEPHLLKNAGDLGITIASAVIAAQQTAGVIAMDMDLKTLSRFLDEHRATPNSLSVLTFRERFLHRPCNASTSSPFFRRDFIFF
jgi:hypothetical protein